ncbi:MAG: beta-lactamase family protein [Gammaproteobacteria bacterium]|nr:beta-lactamase family protein [Gammaproteobacteria bacterium]
MTQRFWQCIAAVAALALLLSASVATRADELSGWSRSDEAFDEHRIKQLDDAIGRDEFKQINSIVVVKNGELLIERYYNGATRDSTHNPRSVGKTFAATVLGIAIEQGYIEGVDQTLGDFYDLDDHANSSASKASVTLEQLISMTSGFEGFDFDPDSPGNEELMYPQDNWVEWTLNLPMAGGRRPGDEWRYFTAGVVVLGDILNRAVPGGLEAYAHEVLFARLGISNYEWQHTPQRVANTAGGIQLTPLDFAKFGELHRLRGEWNGERVVPARWVEQSLQPAIATTEAGNRYGYLWWHRTYAVGDQQWPVAYCSGNGGNKIFVFDEQPLVVVVTASAYGQRYAHRQVDRMMTEYILPAVSTH